MEKEYDKFEEKGRTGLVTMCLILLLMIVYGITSNCESGHLPQPAITTLL